METILVAVIVGSVAVLSLRSLYRTFTGKNEGCQCSGTCASENPCMTVTSRSSGREEAEG